MVFISDNISFENNFDNMTDDERIIKYSFDITVPGYILNSKIPGLAEQVRSYLSAPMIDFTYDDAASPVKLDYQPETDEENLERHVLSDLTNVDSLKLQRGETNGSIESFIENPFVGKGNTEFLRVKNVNSRTGETVVSSSVVKEIDRQYE